MILEAVALQIKHGLEADFEQAFSQAQVIISGMKGYQSHQLSKCLEKKGKYLLLVHWDTLEDHTIGFRQSDEYQAWRKMLHHFYDPFPEVEHFEAVSF